MANPSRDCTLTMPTFLVDRREGLLVLMTSMFLLCSDVHPPRVVSPAFLAVLQCLQCRPRDPTRTSRPCPWPCTPLALQQPTLSADAHLWAPPLVASHPHLATRLIQPPFPSTQALEPPSLAGGPFTLGLSRVQAHVRSPKYRSRADPRSKAFSCASAAPRSPRGSRRLRNSSKLDLIYISADPLLMRLHKISVYTNPMLTDN